jgi:mono/diheme cytochrome c family protein
MRTLSLMTLAGLAALACSAASGAPPATAPDAGVRAHWHLLEAYCEKCHNATDWAGGVAFDTMSPDSIPADAAIWEKAIRKLGGSIMPPPGKPQPDPAARRAMVLALQNDLDRAATAHPNPGGVELHRLNRTEYANAVQEMLGLQIDPAALLPRDDKADGFDNVADVLKVSPAFLEQYLSAARQVSVAAVGNPHARTTSTVYPGAPDAGEYVHKEGLPLGTRGGMLIEHAFPADGDYEFSIDGLVGAGYVWGVMDENTLILTIDDRKVFEQKLGGDQDLAAVDVRQAAGVGEINGRFQHIRRHVTAGPHRIGITYLEKTAAESNEVLHLFVPVAGMSNNVNGNSPGPRIQNVEIKGPLVAEGVSETPSRKRIFVCYPHNGAEELPCARRIFARVAEQAFRRPITSEDLQGALSFYAQGHKSGGFDAGIQKGLMAILVSPKFLYRDHAPPPGTQPGTQFRLGDQELASRLAFFLWSEPPDEELIRLGASGQLHRPEVLDAQVHRLLADPRAHSLTTNFAFQWLNVHGLQLVEPDPNLFPDYLPDLINDFSRELELFVGSVFEHDQAVTDLLSADYTYVNERLALHYGIKGVRGGEFQRVRLQHSYRRGLLGKGAFLMTTSYANRTTPVLRGAYVLEKFLGTPPEAPPPGVPPFQETQEGGRALTVRERMEAHRSNPSCNACHGIIDPIGMALENFNAVGQWRDKDIDAGVAVDPEGKLMDGTPLHGVDDLRNALLARRDQFVRTFTENLLTFALGRTLQYYDMPSVRAIVREAAHQDYRLSSIVLGIVHSDAFQKERAAADERPGEQKVALRH